MALAGPILVVADEANDVCEALTQAGNLPMREALPADAVAAIAKARPSAVVLKGCNPEAVAKPLADAAREAATARWFRCLRSSPKTSRPRLQMLYQFRPTPCRPA